MSNYVNILEIKLGDKIKVGYKEEDSDSDEIFFREVAVVNIDLDEKYVITNDGSKIYGRYANNAYFKVIK